MKKNMYKTIRTIGSGNFGRVELVQNQSDNKYYVMKVIPTKNIFNTETPQQNDQNILKQVQIMRKLCHQFVIRYHDSFTDATNLYIIMQHAQKGQLQTYLQTLKSNNSPLSQSQILHWFIQLCLGLKYIHNQRILHRDLKCENIFITAKNELKIGDFGISKFMRETCELTGTKIGTPCIMAPEIWENKRYNQKSDIWSLGCVLYKMMTLNNAFYSNVIGGYVMKITSGSYAPITGNYSSELKNLVKSMLSLDAHSRPSVHSILQLDFLKKKTQQVLQTTLAQYHQSPHQPTLNPPTPQTQSNNRLLSQKRSLSSLSNSSMLTPKNTHTHTFNNTKIVQMKQSYPILVEEIKTMKRVIEEGRCQKERAIEGMREVLGRMRGLGLGEGVEKLVGGLEDRLQEYESVD